MTAKPSRVPFWRLVHDSSAVTPDIVTYPYAGAGTPQDPYAVTWIPNNDPRNPLNFGTLQKWGITLLVSCCTLSVAFVSSTYTGSIVQVEEEFGIGEEAAIVGLSVFVFGFSLGPLIWSPLSEVFGRRLVLASSFAAFTAFNAGAAGSQNLYALIILRFFAGCFGSSPFGNAGGVIADMFPAAQRGIALSMYTAAPFVGPCLGPVVGGYLGLAGGWRWVEGLLAVLTGALFIAIVTLLPETYAPVLLRRRAEDLSRITGRVYRSKPDIDRQGKVTLTTTLSTALSRPWIMLFQEPIVLLLSIYMAIIYGTLYMFFAAYPIVFQEVRGWDQGAGGLAFLGVLVGTLSAALYNLPEHRRYLRKTQQSTAIPEDRLAPSMVGAIAAPIGLFWFAWTSQPPVHWMSPTAAGAPFGFGLVLVFLSVINYLVDSYAIFAASVLAANTALRSLFAAIFPLFTSYMYHGLGTDWATTLVAFLTVACAPFPFILYKFGPRIRKRCTYSAKAAEYLERVNEDRNKITELKPLSVPNPNPQEEEQFHPPFSREGDDTSEARTIIGAASTPDYHSLRSSLMIQDEEANVLSQSSARSLISGAHKQ